MTTTMPGLRIDVSLAEWPKPPSPSEEQVQGLKERLSTTPTKDPDEIAQHLASRTARTAMLHKLEMDAKLARAKRVNDLVKENRARKLRMEAAAVARASSKIEKATKVECTRREERESKREAAAARRNALFEAVRTARESRQIMRETRQAELAKLELNASSLREKKLQSTVSRSSAQVKHALEVAASLKEKEKVATAAAAARLEERLGAASSRRQDVLAATVEGASSVVQAAEKVRLQHLYSEKAAIEERRLRLAKAMSKALGNREAKIESITSRAAVENARVAEVVADARLSTETTKPASMRHVLAVRMQAAEVRRLESLKKKPRGVRGTASPRSSPDISPSGSQAASPSKVAPPTPWTATTPIGTAPVVRSLFKPAPVIVISTEPFHYAAPTPPQRLLNRLMFRPRMLLVTSAARQAAAKGRRTTMINLIKARASHLGTVRVACVRGRKAAVEEFGRSIFQMRETRAAALAAAHLHAKAKIASQFNERVTAARMRRSNLRLRTLNAAIQKEEKRLIAASKRTVKLTILKEGRWEEAKAFAVKVRRAAATERLVSRSADLEQLCLKATSRRDAVLAGVVSRARRTSMRREVPSKLTDATSAEGKVTEIEVAKAKEAEIKTEATTEPKTEATTEPKTEIKTEPTTEPKTETDESQTKTEPKLEANERKSAITDLDARITELKELLQKRLEAAAATKSSAEEASVVKQRTEYMREAARVSAAAANRAQLRAEAKLKAKAEAEAVKVALKEAATAAGLHGKEAKKMAAVASSAASSAASSVATSDSEDWQVVAETKA